MFNLNIKVGHNAYRTGPNAMALATTKNKAVALLQKRGVKRDAARAVIRYVLAGPGRAASVYGGTMGTSPVEVTNVGDVMPLGVTEAREIINRNPDLALSLYDAEKARGWNLGTYDLATKILFQKMGVA